MKHLIFICTGNTCRSPMAEGIFRKILARRGGDFTCSSAGMFAMAGEPAAANAIAACQELEIDLADHRSKPLTRADLGEDTLLVPLTREYAELLCASVPRHQVYIPARSVSDPFGGDLERYRQCRDEILALCQSLYEELTAHEE